MFLFAGFATITFVSHERHAMHKRSVKDVFIHHHPFHLLFFLWAYIYQFRKDEGITKPENGWSELVHI